jgi:cysteine desulfurase
VNAALLGAGRRLARGRRIVTWAVEHQAVLGAVRRLELEGRPVSVLPVDGAGFAAAGQIPADAGLVSIGLANNELGTLQPVDEVIERARSLGALVHVDACQGPAWLEPPAGADLMSFSGHKVGAGQGGLLRAAREVRLEPLVYGGPQERSRRAGREHVSAAVAMAVGLEACFRNRGAWSAHVEGLAETLRGALLAAGGRPTGGEPRLPGFATAVFPERRGEDMLLALDLAGVAASSGSACASGSLDPSHVLLAAGYSLEEALGSLRLTLSPDTTEAEVERAAEVLRTALPARGAVHA